MSGAEEVPVASGRLLLVPCLLKLDAQGQGLGGDWKEEPAAFAVSSELLKDLHDYAHGEDKGELASDVYFTPSERQASWTAHGQSALFSVEQGDSGVQSPRIRRWSLGPLAQHYSSGTSSGISVRMIELLAGCGLDVRAGRGETSGGQVTAAGVLIVHLTGPWEQGDSLLQRELSKDEGDALKASLLGVAGVAHHRSEFVAWLATLVGEDLFTFDAEVTSREGANIVYPVTSVMHLQRFASSARDSENINDDDVLLMRDIATVSDSNSGRKDRLQRTLGEIVEPGPEWCAMVTGKGAALFSNSKARFDPAEAYVTALYADSMASVMLNHVVLNLLSQGVAQEVARGSKGGSFKAHLKRVLGLRRALLWANSTIGRLGTTESRPHKVLIGAMEANLHIPKLREQVQGDIDALMEVVSIQHQLEEERRAKRAERRERRDEERLRDMDLMFTLLALVAIPLTVFYSYLDLVGPDPVPSAWFWSGTAAFAAIALAFWVRFLAGRAKSKSKHL